MWFGCKLQWLPSVLMIGIHLLAAGKVSADDDVAPPGTIAPASKENAAGAPQHRMNQALIDDVAKPARRAKAGRGLRDLLRHLGCDEDLCPLCGRAASTDEDDSPNDAGSSLTRTASLLQRFLARDPENHRETTPDSKDAAERLRPGEPAQVILDLKRRLGNDVFDGTEFGGSPEALVQWIRTLDEENRRESPQNEPSDEQDDSATEPSHAAGNTAFEIGALREAARKLGEAADLLEDQNLFDLADEVRSTADALREAARDRVQCRSK